MAQIPLNNDLFQYIIRHFFGWDELHKYDPHPPPWLVLTRFSFQAHFFALSLSHSDLK